MLSIFVRKASKIFEKISKKQIQASFQTFANMTGETADVEIFTEDRKDM